MGLLNDRILIAKAMLEWTKDSKTTFITASDELKEIAKKRGLSLPSPDLAVFKTIYAELEKPNRNRVRLPREAVEDGLPSIVGKQINFDHKGSNYICGYMLDGKIEGNNIVVYGAFFKSMFSEEFDEVKAKFEKGQLFVSFEIHRFDDNGDLVVEALSDGTFKMNTIHFAGCGLLIEEDPACPKAQVLKLLASAKALASKVDIQEDNKVLREDLVYAELLKEDNMSEKIKKPLDEKIEEVIDEKSIAEVIKVVKESKEEEVKEEIEAPKIAEADGIKKEAIEVKEEDGKEEAKTVITTTEEVETVRTMDSDESGASEKVEVKAEIKEEVVYDDGVKVTTEEKVDNVVTYTYEYVQDLQTAHTKELEDLKVAHAKEIEAEVVEAKKYAEKITARRISLGDASKDIAEADLADDTKFENLQLKRKVVELESASSIADKEEKADLVVGNDDSVEVAKAEKSTYGDLRTAIDNLCWESK